MNTLASYLSGLPTKRFKKGEQIYLQGIIPPHAFGVLKGLVCVYNLTPNGEHKYITFYTRHDIFPVCWLFSKADQTLYYYAAHTDCEVAIIDKETFHIDLMADPALMHELLQSQMTMYVQLMLRINGLEQPRAAIKILNMFQLLALRYGTVKSDHLVEINIPLTQQTIADFTGLTRETVTLELGRLKKEKVISNQHKTYHVRTDRLNDRMSDEFNPGIHIET